MTDRAAARKHSGDTYFLCDAQQRILAVLMALAGRETDGISMTEIATALEMRAGKSPKSQRNNVHRDLQNLRHAGLAEQLPDSDRWRLAPRVVQIASAYQRYIDRAAQRLDEVRQRYGREYN